MGEAALNQLKNQVFGRLQILYFHIEWLKLKISFLVQNLTFLDNIPVFLTPNLFFKENRVLIPNYLILKIFFFLRLKI